MKFKTTKKAMRDNDVLSVGYCDMQYLLRNEKPIAYSSGVYGWSCDYYEVNNIIISTGYSPIGDSINYEFIKKREFEAQKIQYNNNLSYEEQNKKISVLLKEVTDEFKKMKGWL